MSVCSVTLRRGAGNGGASFDPVSSGVVYEPRRIELENVMASPSLTPMESALRKQQQALLELIHMQLDAIRESNDASVGAMHLQRRLLALAEALGEGDMKVAPPEPGNRQRPAH